MDKRLDSAVQTGTISKSDETAMESALDSICSALSGASSSSGAATSTSRINPSEMKSRVDGLISDQVKAGTLTEDQAAQLKSFFEQGAPSMDGGMGGLSVSGSDDMSLLDALFGTDDSEDKTSSTGSDTDNSTSATSNAGSQQMDALISFLKNLRQNLSSDLYSDSSSSGNSSASNTGLVVDSMA